MISSNAFKLNVVNSRLSSLKNPNILTTIELPKGKAVYINILNNIAEDDNESLAPIKDVDASKKLIYNISALHLPTGKYIAKKVNVAKYDSSVRKSIKGSIIMNKNSKIKLSSNDALVVNFKNMHNGYKYQNYALRDYDFAMNALKTAIHTLVSVGSGVAHNLLMFDCPISIPTVANLKKATNNPMTTSISGGFTSASSILVLELWKLMFDDNNSVFRDIPEDMLETVYIGLVRNGRYTIYSLAGLMSLSKENKIKSLFSNHSPLEAGKILLYTLIQFRANTSLAKEVGIDDDSDDSDDTISLTDVDGLLDEEESYGEITVDEKVLINEPMKNIKKRPTKFTEAPTNENVDTILRENIVQGTSTGGISKPEMGRLEETLSTYKDRVFEINGVEQTLGDILDYSKVPHTVAHTPHNDTETVIDKGMLSNNNRNFDKEYMATMYQKDVYNAIYSLHNSNILITDHKVEKEKNFLGEREIHTIRLKPLDGEPSTHKLYIPAISPEDSTYEMSSNSYLLRCQRMDLPIRKTDSNTVLLTSYSGKLFILKNIHNSKNPGTALAKIIATDDRFSNIIMKGSIKAGLKLPKGYTLFATSIARFKFNNRNFIFDYTNRLSIDSKLSHSEILSLENKHNVTFISSGKTGDGFMDANGHIVSIVDGALVDHGDTEGYFDMSLSKTPLEIVYIKVLGKAVPLGVILLYFMGLTRLLGLMDIPKRVEEMDYKLTRGEFGVILSDGILVFDRANVSASLVFGGLNKTITSSLTVDELDNKDSMNILLNILELSIAHMNGITSIEIGFLDNITKDTLVEMGEPNDIHKLLLRAVELLVDDNYNNPQGLSENRLVRSERIPGLIHKTLNNATKSYNNRNTLSKAKMIIDPYAVWKAISDDSTSMPIDNTNPIAFIKQKDNVTFLGEFGRSRITMTRDTRIMGADEIGTISESTPDSGDSGISTYLTHSANITNLRGMVSEVDLDDVELSTVLSTANIINPNITTDSPNRVNFSSVQASHIIPMREMRSTRLWTGGESVIAGKVGKPFVEVAEDYGVVKKVSKKSISIEYSTPNTTIDIQCGFIKPEILNYIVLEITNKGYVTNIHMDVKLKSVEYTIDGKTSTTKLWKKTSDIDAFIKSLPKKKVDTSTKKHTMADWASKVEGGTSIRHTMGTSLVVGDVVKPGQAVIYDTGFFEPNIYDPSSIVLKMGSFFNVAFIEKKTTYEDSIEFNRAIVERTGETKYGVSSKIIQSDDYITNLIPEGSEVSYGDKLMTIVDSNLVGSEGISDRAKLILSEAVDASPESKYDGVIDRIDVIYNCELEDMNESVRALADISNKRFMDSRGVTGQVDSQYSIDGAPLNKGEIEIKYFISSEEDTKTGDKFIIGHQLKNTIGNILDEIETEDGEQVDLIFSTRSTEARIAPSTFINATTNAIMKDATNRAITAYRK